MATSRPSWIFFKLQNDGHHPRVIGKHHIRFHDSICYGLGDLGVNAHTDIRTDRRDSNPAHHKRGSHCNKYDEVMSTNKGKQ